MCCSSVRLLFVLSLGLVGGACSGLVGDGTNGIYARVPVGSTFHLYERILIPPGRAQVWVKGDTLSNGVGSFESACAIEVREIKDQETQFVEPGDFRINQVQDLWTEVVHWHPHPATGVRFQRAAYGSGGGKPLIYEGYHFWLESKEHPNVMRLTCVGVYEDISDASPPTLAEIRSALGGYARIELAGES